MVAHPLPVENGVSTRSWSASVNGRNRQIIIRDHDILLDVLRDGVGTLGAKRGCDKIKTIKIEYFIGLPWLY